MFFSSSLNVVCCEVEEAWACTQPNIIHTCSFTPPLFFSHSHTALKSPIALCFIIFSRLSHPSFSFRTRPSPPSPPLPSTHPSPIHPPHPFSPPLPPFSTRMMMQVRIPSSSPISPLCCDFSRSCCTTPTPAWSRSPWTSYSTWLTNCMSTCDHIYNSSCRV